MKINAVILLIFVSITACSNHENRILPVVSDYMIDGIVEIRELRVGVVSGPYWDMFEKAVLPILEEMGYTATMFYYHDYASPNFALAQKEIDLNIFQHYVYLNNFKFDNDLDLSAIIEIPTVSMSVFSGRFNSINGIEKGTTVSIPQDASNLARALRVLESANIITLNPSIDKLKATLADIIINPREIRIIPIPAHGLVESLETYDVAIVNGNYAVSGGLDLSEALFHEMLVENYMNVVAVRTEDLNKQFVMDIIKVINSADFCDIIADPAGDYTNFQWPRWLHDMLGGEP